MYNNLKYALVSGHITQYQEGTLEHYLSEYDNETPMVRWVSALGINCYTSADNFIEGTYEELKAIIDEQNRVHKEKVKMFCLQYPQLTKTEMKLVDYLISDGYEPEELTYRQVHSMADELCSDYYRENCNSLLEAYMFYMH